MEPDNVQKTKTDNIIDPHKQTNMTGCKGFFLKTWHPVPSVNSTIFLFLIIGVIFIIFGIVLVLINSGIKEASVRYDNYGACSTLLEGQ